MVGGVYVCFLFFIIELTNIVMVIKAQGILEKYNNTTRSGESSCMGTEPKLAF